MARGERSVMEWDSFCSELGCYNIQDEYLEMLFASYLLQKMPKKYA